jgi:DNA repair and recombination protein RAD52
MSLKEDKIEKLNKKLDPSRIKVREQAGRKLSYVEGYDIMNAANDIFGYDGWMHEIVGEVKTVKAGQVKDSQGNLLPGWISKATVKIGIRNEEREWVYHTDTGLCIPAISLKNGFTEPSPDSIETAEKGAVTDAMKRAFRALGNQFGLSLYDKDDEDSKAAQNGTTGGNNANSNQTTYTPPAPTNKSTNQGTSTGKVCPNCGGIMEYKEGVSKAGKAYKGYFCPNQKANNCKAEFIN